MHQLSIYVLFVLLLLLNTYFRRKKAEQVINYTSSCSNSIDLISICLLFALIVVLFCHVLICIPCAVHGEVY